MSKGRTETSSNWQSQPSSSPYLDSAYKQLLRQEQKSTALKNRTKVLQLTQSSMLRHIENNHNKWSRLESIKENHSIEVARIAKEKENKGLQANKLKEENERKRQLHLRYMSSVALEKAEDVHRIKREALALRQENLKLIEQNREAESLRKQQTRNKIHEDILQSRATIKHFFDQKHQNIVAANSEDVRKLNLKRVKGELQCRVTNEVEGMQEEVRRLRQNLCASRVRPGDKREVTRQVGKHEQEEKHPLVKKIENAMNRYTKFM